MCSMFLGAVLLRHLLTDHMDEAASVCPLAPRPVLWPPLGPHHGLFPQVTIHLGHLVLVHLVELGVDLLLGIDDILLQHFLWQGLHTVRVGHGRLRGSSVARRPLLLVAGVVSDVAANHKTGQHLILR